MAEETKVQEGGYFSRGLDKRPTPKPLTPEEIARRKAAAAAKNQGRTGIWNRGLKSEAKSEARDILSLFEENADVTPYPCVKCGTPLTIFQFTDDPLCDACKGKGKTGAEKID
jgi:hypothetical protein